MAKSKIKILETENSMFIVEKEPNGKIYINMNGEEGSLSVKETKSLIEILRKTILEA